MSRKVRAAAAHWFAILRDVPEGHPERVRFEAWLAADPAHAAAFDALTRVWGQLNSSSDIKRLADSMERLQGERLRTRRRILKQGLLGLLLAGGAGGGVYRWRTQAQWRMEYRSDVGATDKVPLSDGSTLILGAASGARVDFSRTERHVELTRGQAVFDVAREAGRPFVVESGFLRVTVIGTQFSVERFSNRVRVSVDHGTVRLSAGPFWRRQTLIMTDGQVADLVETADGTPSFVRSAQPAADGFAFLHGQIIFDRAHLEEIAETLSRYRAKPVRVAPESQSSPPITAVVQLNDIDAFLRSLAAVNPVTVTDRDGQTWLSCRHR